MNQKILILATGGTLDKEYNALTGELEFSHSHVKHMLTQAQSALDVDLNVLMLKDSLEMNLVDRQMIAQACISSRCKQIVITHGTDTITDTAEHLLEYDKLENKTVILTGSMRPHKFGHSDALFNLGTALMAAQIAEPGVYITMNGQLHPAGTCIKDRSRGIFVQKN